MSDHEIGKQEAIERLKGERIEILEAIKSLTPEQNKVEVYELLEKIAIIDDQITKIQTS